MDDFFHLFTNHIRNGDTMQSKLMLNQYLENKKKLRIQDGITLGAVQLDTTKDFQKHLPIIAAVEMFESEVLSDIQEGHIIDMLTFLLENGFSVNRRNQAGETALMIAVKRNSLSIVDFLLSVGSDPTINNLDGVSLLMASFKTNNKPLIQRLISIDEINIEIKDNNNNSLLHYAAAEGQLDFVKIFTGMKANIHDENNFGETPIFPASRNGHLEIVNFLISKGAEVIHLNNQGETPIVVARLAGYSEVEASLKGAWSYKKYTETKNEIQINRIEKNYKFLTNQFQYIQKNQKDLQQLLFDLLANEETSATEVSETIDKKKSISKISQIPTFKDSINDDSIQLESNLQLKELLLPQIEEIKEEIAQDNSTVVTKSSNETSKDFANPQESSVNAVNEIWFEMVDDIEDIGHAVQIREYYERIGMIPAEYL